MANKYAPIIEKLQGTIVRASLGATPIVLSEDDLQSIEEKIGYPLPTDYREFLTNYGGYSLYGFFKMKEGDSNAISLFYGLMPRGNKIEGSQGPLYDATCDILWNWEGLSVWKPQELLPLGDDSGGNQICISLSGENRGSIYFWDRIDAWQTQDYTGIYLIADSFDEFMKLLRPDSIFEP